MLTSGRDQLPCGKTARGLLQHARISSGQYAIGHSMVFLKAGILGTLENMCSHVDR